MKFSALAPTSLPRMLTFSMRNPRRLFLFFFFGQFGLLPLELVLYGLDLGPWFFCTPDRD
ncbi:hypothetical protein ACE6H2_016399 [Prunus campanulata]